MSPSEAKTREPIAATGEDIAGPLPTNWNVPIREGRTGNDIHGCSKDHWWPASATEECIGGPCICQCRHNCHCVCCSGIYVDLPDFVLRVLAPLKVLRENRRGRGTTVVEGDI